MRQATKSLTRSARVIAVLAAPLAGPLSAQSAPTPPTTKGTTASVPAAFASVTGGVSSRIDGQRALTTVDYVQRFFRLPGNRGFDHAIDTVAALLRAAGYVAEEQAPPTARLVYRVESRPMPQAAWTPLQAELTLSGRTTPLQRFATNLNMIAINSGSTPDSGVRADVVDVGAGTEADFGKVNVTGRIVFSTGPARQVFPRAMQKGAIGVLNTQKLPEYNQQTRNSRAIQFSGIQRDSIRNGWLLWLSAQSADSLRAALAAGPVTVKAVVSTLFETRPERTIVAEIRGRTRPAERFVYSAHVQEPGANDNASGVGALAEMARVAAQLVRRGAVNPQRTLTFLWGDEIRSTDRFIKEDSVRRTGIRWGMSLDMVGENTALTGGTFLIEKMPDPSAVWVRGEDQHTEWGGRVLAEKDIRPHWFNDFVRQRCLDRARTTNWVVKANPFEGGSDHTPFLNAQIPAVLLWHFSDQFYHTDLDRIDMVSPSTLANVGACALTAGLLLTDGSLSITRAALTELTTVAERALAIQAQLSRDTIAKGAKSADEQHVLEVWRDYYLTAIARIPDIAVGPVDLTADIAAAQDRVRRAVPLLR
jgi:aminopeptidase YwaD